MHKLVLPYVEDMIECITRIERYLEEIENNQEKFFQNLEKQDAVLRRLERHHQ